MLGVSENSARTFHIRWNELGTNHLIFTGGTSFEMMHAIFFRGPLYANNFFSDVTVSKQFFSWKIFGTSP